MFTWFNCCKKVNKVQPKPVVESPTIIGNEVSVTSSQVSEHEVLHVMSRKPSPEFFSEVDKGLLADKIYCLDILKETPKPKGRT